MRKIDAHMHVNLRNYKPDFLIDYLDRNDIEKCWLLSWEELSPPIPSLYNKLSIEDIINTYQKYPDRIIPFYAPDPQSATLSDDLKKYMQLGVKGCGELKVTYRWDDEVINNYLEVISKLGVPLLFHMELPRQQYIRMNDGRCEKLLEKLLNGAYNGVTRYYLRKLSGMTSLYSGHICKNSVYFPGYLYDFDALEKRINQFPELIFIGHGPHFWNSISEDLSEKYIHQKGNFKSFGIIDHLLEAYDNFYCDISGKSGFNALNRNIDKTKSFVDKHSNKLLYGTDNTSIDFEEFLLSLGLPDSKMKKICYSNAQNIIFE